VKAADMQGMTFEGTIKPKLLNSGGQLPETTKSKPWSEAIIAKVNVVIAKIIAANIASFLVKNLAKNTINPVTIMPKKLASQGTPRRKAAIIYAP
jgi:hypothetical protein